MNEATPDLTVRLWIDSSAFGGRTLVEVVAQIRSFALVVDLTSQLVETLRITALDAQLLTVNGALLQSDRLLSDCQLVQGQTLRLAESSDDETCLQAPVISQTDVLRLVHEVGPQLGLAWSCGEGERLEFADAFPVLSGRARVAMQPKGPARMLVSRAQRDGLPFLILEKIDPNLVVRIDDLYMTSDEARAGVGSVVQIGLSSHDESDFIQLRVMRRDDHEASRNRHGFVALKVFAESEWSNDDEPDLELRARPSSRRPEFDWAEIALQDGSILLLSIGMMFAFGGFALWRLFYLILPIARVAYRLRQHQAKIDDWEQEETRWKAETTRELGVLHTYALHQADAIRARNRSVDSLVQSVELRGRSLWVRDRRTSLFGSFGLGVGEYQTPKSVRVPGPSTSGDRQAFQQYAESMRVVPDTPVEHNISSSHLSIGSYSPELLAEATNSALMRILESHSPLSMKVVVLLPDVEHISAQLSWVATSPHCRSHSTVVPQDRVRFGKQSSDKLLSELAEAEARAEPTECVLLVVHDAANIDSSLLDLALRRHPVSLRLLWLASGSLVPASVSHQLFVYNPDRAVYSTSSSGARQQFAPFLVASSSVGAFAQFLTPLVDDTGDAVSSGLPDSVALLPLTERVESLSAVAQLITALGETAAGVFDLDLVDAGPHLLIGGTTGSGKSELLRTLVLTLANRYAPSECRFLLIDYKGGASLKTLRRLPHQIGFVSNLGEDEVERCIQFLSAELESRQEILADYDGDYAEYRRQTGRELPRIVVVIDEFGGFATGGSKGRQRAVLDIAARGRSQGVHLILATQSPRTVVSDEVRANVNARICLRTLDARESVAVIGEEAAAFIPRDLKGRCFARLDTGALVQFQSGFSQSQSFYGDMVAPVQIGRVEFTRVPIDEVRVAGRKARDDLELISRLVDAYGESILAGPLRRRRAGDPEPKQAVLLPSLSEHSDKYLAVERSFRDESTLDWAEIGECDDPRQRAQYRYLVDLSRGSLLLSGGTKTGRTHALAVVAAYAVQCRRPPVVVAVDGTNTGELGELLGRTLGTRWGWNITEDIAPKLERLCSQVSRRSAIERNVLILVDRIDLMGNEARSIVGDIERLLASGSKQGARTVATSDDRSMLPDEFVRAFRFRGSLRQDGSRILEDERGLLARVNFLPKELRVGPAAPPFTERVGELTSEQVAAVVTSTPRPQGGSLRVFFDDDAHRVVDMDPRRSLAVVGPAGSGRSALVDLLGQELHGLDRASTPRLCGRGARGGVNLGPEWIDLGAKVSAAAAVAGQAGLMTVDSKIFIESIQDDVRRVGRLVISDLDYLQYFADALGFMWSTLSDALAKFLTIHEIQVVASGPLGILDGRGSEANRVSDRLRRVEANFIMLEPPDEDTVAGELRVFRGGAAAKYAARAGTTYSSGFGYAFVDGVRHEGHSLGSRVERFVSR